MNAKVSAKCFLDRIAQTFTHPDGVAQATRWHAGFVAPTNEKGQLPYDMEEPREGRGFGWCAARSGGSAGTKLHDAGAAASGVFVFDELLEQIGG